jgi:hypothetical protein
VNLTRWTIRLPGTQRRNAAASAGADSGGVPAARAERVDPPAGDGRNSGGRGIDALAIHELLGQVPAPVAVLHGDEHRIAYVNEAYATVFGARTPGAPARAADRSGSRRSAETAGA